MNSDDAMRAIADILTGWQEGVRSEQQTIQDIYGVVCEWMF